MPRKWAEDAVVHIVDDDVEVGKALCRLARSAGLRAVAFASPAELLRYGHLGERPCLLLDVQLPGMDGFALYSQIRASINPVPVIFMTAQFSRRTRERARAVDAVDCLQKPFDDEVLLGAIEAALLGNARG